MVKYPSASAEDTTSISGLGRSHMLWSNEARGPLLSLGSGAWDLQLLSLCAVTPKPECPRDCAPQQEKPHSERPRHHNEDSSCG